MANKPNISFIVPYRWISDPKDRAFLGDNLAKRIKAIVGEDDLKVMKRITDYSVRLVTIGYRPVNIDLTTKQIQSLLKVVFPHGKCLELDEDYEHSKSKTSLPMIDFQIYF